MAAGRQIDGGLPTRLTDGNCRVPALYGHGTVDTGGGPLSWLTRAREQAKVRIASAKDADRIDASPPKHAADHRSHALVVEPMEPSIDEGVPRGVRTAAAWAWRLLALAFAAYVFFIILGRLTVVVIPIVVALLLTALLYPVAAALRARSFPPALASAIVLVGGLLAVAGVLTAVINAFINGFADLADQVSAGIDQIRSWLASGPLHISQDQINSALDSAQKAISNNQGALTSGVATVTSKSRCPTGPGILVNAKQ